PGNVRELINALEYAVVLCPGGMVEPGHLPEPLRHGGAQAAPLGGQAAPQPVARRDERERIIQALQQTGGRREEAASLLGISRVTLWKKIKAYDIQIENKIR
ncbi:MAG: helix-turn-helix domain-containing protein, partial [Pseudomonadota bacterium]